MQKKGLGKRKRVKIERGGEKCGWGKHTNVVWEATIEALYQSAIYIGYLSEHFSTVDEGWLVLGQVLRRLIRNEGHQK